MTFTHRSRLAGWIRGRSVQASKPEPVRFNGAPEDPWPSHESESAPVAAVPVGAADSVPQCQCGRGRRAAAVSLSQAGRRHGLESGPRLNHRRDETATV